jgi:DNA polymerase-4
MCRVIFHVDMDAFFASVEQRDHPEYRGRPLVVGGTPGQRGVVCAASYEARKFGVRSAMPVRTAERLCPQAVFVRPRMDAYRAESEQIMAILGRHTPLLERVSVDEAYLDMSRWCAGAPSPDAAMLGLATVAEAIRREIRETCELTASVGVATNKFLAKLGSDLDKPNGLTVIPEEGKSLFLRPLSVRRIHGVGPVTAGGLEARGLHTIGDLQDTKIPLEPLVGSFAPRLR